MGTPLVLTPGIDWFPLCSAQVGDLLHSSPESSGVDPPGATLPWDPAVALPRITASYIIQDSGQ